jgi:hypothetical protein
MNFLKNVVNKASSGIELERLKYERGNLKKEIRHLEAKISSWNQQTELKRTLVEGLDKINQTFEQVTIMCASNNLITTANTSNSATTSTANTSTATTSTASATSTNPDNESDDGVEDSADPDSFENIQKASYQSLQSHRDDIKNIIDKLTIILASGVDKIQSDIDKKKKRIEDINKRLSVIRSKN